MYSFVFYSYILSRYTKLIYVIYIRTLPNPVAYRYKKKHIIYKHNIIKPINFSIRSKYKCLNFNLSRLLFNFSNQT